MYKILSRMYTRWMHPVFQGTRVSETIIFNVTTPLCDYMKGQAM